MKYIFSLLAISAFAVFTISIQNSYGGIGPPIAGPGLGDGIFCKGT